MLAWITRVTDEWMDRQPLATAHSHSYMRIKNYYKDNKMVS